jgi:peptide/nickel transport system ATP-binding protein
MEATVLKINNLCVDFTLGKTTQRAVHNLYVQVKKGELVAIVGESGSGKSVTALSILGLLDKGLATYPYGEILFHHEGTVTDLLHTDESTRRNLRGNRIAMIFQEPMTALNPVYTCGFQVAEAIRLHEGSTHEEAKEKAIALFEKVKLPDPPAIFDRYPHQLSGGQKQRVMIAMAMSCRPSLLICDEPTTALDVTVQRNILELIRELQQQYQMGVIFITHDLGVVAEIADRVAVMYRGKIVEEKTTHELFNAPEHPYTKALLACRPSLYPKGQRLPVVSDFMGTAGAAIQPVLTSISPTEEITDVQEPILTVSDLRITYPGAAGWWGRKGKEIVAVQNISFSVNKGETLGLVGESGCGKSTLGRALLGLIPVHAGNIRFKGQELTHLSPKERMQWRKDMQLIFQDPYSSLNPRQRIGDAIAEPLRVHGIATNQRDRKERVIHLLEQVQLGAEHYDRYPHEFSGGQRQRIVIARALALEPDFIVCDESVSALDVSVQAQVLNLLNDLKKQFSFTAIFISHDLSVVRYISDRIAVMQKGSIVELGPAQQVYDHPQNDYTRQLIAAIPGKQLIR